MACQYHERWFNVCEIAVNEVSQYRAGTRVLPTKHLRREIFLGFVEDVSDNKETLPCISLL